MTKTEFKLTAYVLHLYFCKKDHINNECKFYEEDVLDDPWNESSHIEWIEAANKIFDEDSSFVDAQRLIKLAGESYGKLEIVALRNKELIKYVTGRLTTTV